MAHLYFFYHHHERLISIFYATDTVAYTVETSNTAPNLWRVDRYLTNDTFAYYGDIILWKYRFLAVT